VRRPITGSTQLYGIFGDPVDHSLSPLMHNAAFADKGMDAVYVAFPVSRKLLRRAVRAIPALGLRGINVTVPHKRAIFPLLTRVEPSAALAGAVNTVEVRGRELVGHNTDGEGLVASLEEDLGIRPRGLDILVLGAGGAARGVAVALAHHGARAIHVANRTVRRATRLVRTLSEAFPSTRFQATGLSAKALAAVVPLCHVVINATALGLREDDPSPLPEELLHAGLVVVDLIYHRETRLLREARRQGATTLGGVGMLLHQGALAFRIWTGEEAPLEAMRRALESVLGRASEGVNGKRRKKTKKGKNLLP